MLIESFALCGRNRLSWTACILWQTSLANVFKSPDEYRFKFWNLSRFFRNFVKIWCSSTFRKLNVFVDYFVKFSWIFRNVEIFCGSFYRIIQLLDLKWLVLKWPHQPNFTVLCVNWLRALKVNLFARRNLCTHTSCFRIFTIILRYFCCCYCKNVRCNFCRCAYIGLCILKNEE